MKRYDLVTNYRCGDAIEEMESYDDGEWMRYEDHAAIVAGYEQRLALISWWSEPRPINAVDPVLASSLDGPRATDETVLSDALTVGLGRVGDRKERDPDVLTRRATQADSGVSSPPRRPTGDK